MQQTLRLMRLRLPCLTRQRKKAKFLRRSRKRRSLTIRRRSFLIVNQMRKSLKRTGLKTVMTMQVRARSVNLQRSPRTTKIARRLPPQKKQIKLRVASAISQQ